MNEPPLTWHAFQLRENDSGMVTADYSLDNGAWGMSWEKGWSGFSKRAQRRWASICLDPVIACRWNCTPANTTVPPPSCTDSYGGDAKMKRRLWSITARALRKRFKWECAIPSAPRKYSADEGNHWYLEIDFIAVPFPICGPCAS